MCWYSLSERPDDIDQLVRQPPNMRMGPPLTTSRGSFGPTIAAALDYLESIVVIWNDPPEG